MVCWTINGARGAFSRGVFLGASAHIPLKYSGFLIAFGHVAMGSQNKRMYSTANPNYWPNKEQSIVLPKFTVPTVVSSSALELFKSVLPALPYKEDQMLPLFSQEQMTAHYHLHQTGYAVAVATHLAEKAAKGDTHQLIMKLIHDSGPVTPQACQLYNHALFFESIVPIDKFKDLSHFHQVHTAVEKSFSTVAQFEERLVTLGKSVLGSGWLWLYTTTGDDLHWTVTSNTDNLARQTEKRPVAVFDLWEHTYYLDYVGLRPEYLKKILKQINWAFVAQRLVAPATWNPWLATSTAEQKSANEL